MKRNDIFVIVVNFLALVRLQPSLKVAQCKNNYSYASTIIKELAQLLKFRFLFL